MTELRHSDVLLAPDEEAGLIAGARDTQPVRGLTHGFYKYPARFSPAFARAAIRTFTHPGDLVLDNHVGGGTTLVEALADWTAASAIVDPILPVASRRLCPERPADRPAG
jgi:hypothetical protein